MEGNIQNNNNIKIIFAILGIVMVSIPAGIVYSVVNNENINYETDESLSQDYEFDGYNDDRPRNTRSGDDENWLGSWAPKAPMPTARSDFAIGVVNEHIYAIGGHDSSGDSNVTEEFDPETDTWTTKAPMPTARRNLAVAVVSDKIYAIGGSIYDPSYGTGWRSLATVECYDPSTDSWSTLADMPTPRMGLASGTVKGKIYAIGGHDYNSSQDLNVTEEYDPITDIWVTKSPMFTPRCGLVVGVVNDMVYAIGGWLVENLKNVTEEYNPETNTWNVKAPMPTARTWLAVGVINNIIYAIGGFRDYDTVNNTEAYDCDTNTWTIKAPILTSRSSFAIGEVNNKLYAIGGLGGLTRIEEFIPSPPHHIIITPSNATITADQNQQFNAPIYDEYNNTLDLNVNWEVTNGSIDENGLYCPNTDGNWTIFANFSYDSLFLSTMANITVVVDNDNDGMDDFWEVKFGLDIYNSSDANLDPDLDYLTNLQEFLNYSEPNNNDTDGDNLGDGFEVIFSKTNASLWDTNGNGIGDGLEFIQSKGYLGWIESLPDDWIGMTITWDNYTILVKTNSSVLEGEFDKEEQKLKIKVSGPEGTQGVTEMDIPKSLCDPDDIEIQLDGELINYTLTEDDTYYYIHIEYNHSIHELSAIFGQTSEIPGQQTDDEKIFLENWPLIGLIIAIIIIILLLILITRIRGGKEDIGVQELPPEKLLVLLEKQHAEGKITDETYDDAKSLLEQYGGV